MSDSASADLLRLLAALAEPPTDQHTPMATALGLMAPASLEKWQVAHTGAFIEQCPPHVSIIVGLDGQMGGEAADRVEDFRRLLGGNSSPGGDKLPALLADYAELVEQARRDERARHAQVAMLWEHLLCWLMPYLDSVRRSAPPPYAEWASLLQKVLYLEAETTPAPQRFPLHLRSAPPAADLTSADKVEQAIRLLLTPSASGLVLTRHDLAHAARHVGGAPVHTSRAGTLEYLLKQEGVSTLRWLAQEAQQQHLARQSEQPQLGDSATFWSERAAHTAQSLTILAMQADKKPRHKVHDTDKTTWESHDHPGDGLEETCSEQSAG